MIRAIYLSLSVLLLVVAGCADGALGPDPSPTPDPDGNGDLDINLTVSIRTDTLRAIPGDVYVLVAHVDSEPLLDPSPTIMWSSSDESVATVSVDDTQSNVGSVEFVGMGRASIVATATDSSGTVEARDSVAVYIEWEQLADFPDIGNRPLLLERDPNSGRVFASYQRGLQASDDNGVSWYPVETGLGVNSWVYSLEVSSHGSALLATAYNWTSRANTLLLSTDGGDTWADKASGIPHVSDHEELYGAVFDGAAAQTIYALTRDDALRIYKSDDLGSSWYYQGTTFPFVEGRVPLLFSVPTQPGHLYIGAHRSFHSDDGGETWAEIVRPEQTTSFSPDFAITHVDRSGRAYIQDYNWDGAGDIRIHRLRPLSGTLDRLVDRLESLVDITTDAEDERFVATLGIHGSGPGSPLRYSDDDGTTWQSTTVPRGIYGDPRRLTVLPDQVPHMLVYIENGSGSVWRYRRAD